MLEKRVGGIRFRLSLLFPALLTVLLLRQGDTLALSCVLASVMHECGHLLAMLLLGCRPDVCTLGAFGMRIETGRRQLTGYGRNIVISLAGPAVNALAAVGWWIARHPETALVHAVLGVLNLLPAAALDGGQVLRCLLEMGGIGDRAPVLLRAVSAAVLLPLAVAAVYLVLSGKGNGTLLLVSIYLTVLVFFSPP